MDSGSTWSLRVYIRLCCRLCLEGPCDLALSLGCFPAMVDLHMGVVPGDSCDVVSSGSYTQGWL